METRRICANSAGEPKKDNYFENNKDKGKNDNGQIAHQYVCAKTNMGNESSQGDADGEETKGRSPFADPRLDLNGTNRKTRSRSSFCLDLVRTGLKSRL